MGLDQGWRRMDPIRGMESLAHPKCPHRKRPRGWEYSRNRPRCRPLDGASSEKAKRLTGIDISEESVAICREKFADFDHVAFHANDGSSLSPIEDSSVDTIWSFDVFVHINESEVAEYAEEFARVLRTGGRGIIHHGTVAGKEGGWRSDLTITRFNEILKANGLRLISQFDEWVDNGKNFKAGLYQDGITVFLK